MEFFNKMVAGYREERGRPALPTIPPTSEDDVKDYQPDGYIGGEATAADPVRTISDVLDFLQYVVEETTEWIDREAGEGHAPRFNAGKPKTLPVREVTADHWKSSRRTLRSTENAQPVAHGRDDRRYLRFVNWGPEVVYLTPESNPGKDMPRPDALTLLPSNVDGSKYFPLVLESRYEVWAATTDAGGVGVATLEITDVYGDPE